MLNRAIVLLNNNFRLRDNAILDYATKNYKEIILIYIHYNNRYNKPFGAASNVFLYYTLQSFIKSLNLINATLNLFIVHSNSEYIDLINTLINKYSVNAVLCSKSYININNVDDELKNSLIKEHSNLIFKYFNDKLLFIDYSINNSFNKAYSVFTPYSKAALQYSNLVVTFSKITAINTVNIHNNISINNLNLLPKNEGEWHINLCKYWQFNENTIYNNYCSFVNNKLSNYAVNRNYLSGTGNSNISAYLYFGILSIREVFLLANNYIMANHLSNQFILELLWREFAYYCHKTYKNIDTIEIKPEYSNFDWQNNKNYFTLWTKSKTGYKIIDAAMNQLYTTGFMHNRMRMVVASFLIKNLQINWQLGEQWFYNTLVDADFVVNAFSWQWVFGSGLDSAPYFRIFNPLLQQQKFDYNNEYTILWLPKNYNCVPIVNLQSSSKSTMVKYKQMLAISAIK